jgi:hypothetical protein
VHKSRAKNPRGGLSAISDDAISDRGDRQNRIATQQDRTGRLWAAMDV